MSNNLDTIDANIASGKWPDRAIHYAILAHGLYEDIGLIVDVSCKNILQWILDSFKKQNRTIKNASTHMGAALDANDVGVVKILLEHDYCNNQHSLDRLLHKATNNEYALIVDLLLEYGANPESGDNYALDCAMRRGNVVIMEMLVNALSIVNGEAKGPSRLYHRVCGSYSPGGPSRCINLLRKWIDDAQEIYGGMQREEYVNELKGYMK